MNPEAFDELERTLTAEGPGAAIERLCARLREWKDYNSLFYALLLKKRHELGVSPVPTGSSQDLPDSAHAPYEDAIREAARLVGRLYLDAGDLPQAWLYFRMIGEPEPVREALEKHQPGEDEDVQGLIHIAYYEGAHPRKGFDWILQRSGICNAITTLGSMEVSQAPEVRRHCLRGLVRALYNELRDRLGADIAQRSGEAPEGATVRELLNGRDWIFEEDYAHVDVSHLSAVVQMSTHLDACPELHLVRELCAYGRRLRSPLSYAGDPPFEELYPAHDLYLAALAGDKADETVAYFRDQAEKADPETVGTYPAEVLVTLLLRLERPAEALAVARRYLAAADSRRLSCPSITELCQKANDYRTLAEVAREQGDPVHFVAGLIAGGKRG